MESLELQLSELHEQVQLVQQHYQSMQECMRRDAQERERLQLENGELTRDNTQMAIEIEQMRESMQVMREENECMG